MKIKVGMADLNVVLSPGILYTLGLGSCVGIALYDNRTKIAGLAHIMLPSSKAIKNNQNKAKFADTGIEMLIDKMVAKGAIIDNITAKIAGGAQMFTFQNEVSDLLNIGQQNISAVMDVLRDFGIP
ncbi:MAG: chemotaxis protein CheD, partial [Clostridiales bacterium]|nr:chemotaxis protein CheD [Clostridiales bacterium]